MICHTQPGGQDLVRDTLGPAPAGAARTLEPLAGSEPAATADPKDSLARHLRGAFAMDLSLLLPAPARPTYRWPDQKPGRLSSRASSQSCRAVTATRAGADRTTADPRKDHRMPMLAGHVDAVIGVDTHRDHHTVAVVDPTGGVVATIELATDAFGYRRMLTFAVQHGPGRRIWAIEGTGSYGSGLTTFLLERGEWVAEIDRPARRARRDGAKTDTIDAVRAAREALSREHLAQPRRRGDREAMRVLLTTRAGTSSRARRRSANSRPSSSAPPRDSASSCATAPPTPSSTAAPGYGPLPPTASSTAAPFARSGSAPAKRCSWKPRPLTWRPSSRTS